MRCVGIPARIACAPRPAMQKVRARDSSRYSGGLRRSLGTAHSKAWHVPRPVGLKGDNRVRSAAPRPAPGLFVGSQGLGDDPARRVLVVGDFQPFADDDGARAVVEPPGGRRVWTSATRAGGEATSPARPGRSLGEIDRRAVEHRHFGPVGVINASVTPQSMSAERIINGLHARRRCAACRRAA